MPKLHYYFKNKRIYTYDCCVRATNDPENRFMVIVSCNAPNVICFDGTFSNNKVNVKKYIENSDDDFDFVIWKRMYCSSLDITNNEYFKLGDTCYKLTKNYPRIRE